MKPFNILAAPLLAATVFCMVSCGGQDNKSGNDETATDSATNTTTNAQTAANTVITAPQNMLVVRHKVANFNKWKTSYDAHDSMRLASGVHNYVIGRGVKDSNMVLVAVKTDDANKAKAFGKNPSLKKAMQQGGVVGAPAISLTTMTYQDTAVINTDLRSRTTFTVKDWDTWQKKFDSSRQMRLDHGIMDRAYGHDVDNNHKVTVVVALIDTAKAFAYWKSDELKKMQTASGMSSPPERFLYRVVTRY
jgi:hypothetical protein